MLVAGHIAGEPSTSIILCMKVEKGIRGHLPTADQSLQIYFFLKVSRKGYSKEIVTPLLLQPTRDGQVLISACEAIPLPVR